MARETESKFPPLPELETLVMPADPRGRPASPVLHALSKAWNPVGVAVIASLLRDVGIAIPQTPEAETAAAAYFMLGHALRSGEAWPQALAADLKERQTRVDAAKPRQPRAQHIRESKHRALQVVDFDPAQAVSRMAKDLAGHPETRELISGANLSKALVLALGADPGSCRRWIEGFLE